MSVPIDEIAATTEDYLSRFPEERESLAPLLRFIEAATELPSRKEFRGHVTCGAILIDPSWRVLHVEHRALQCWLLPGGTSNRATARWWRPPSASCARRPAWG